MTHIVLFKFLQNDNKEILIKILNETYIKLRDEFNVIEDYSFKANILDNSDNMDFILFVNLRNKEDLSAYINHPVHKEFLQKFKEYGLCGKSVIDV